MSHFSCLVIEDEPESILGKFNEQDEEYMEFVNMSEDEGEQEKYETESVSCVEDPKGEILYSWNAKDSSGKSIDIEDLPEGWKMKPVPYKVLHTTYEEYLKEWHGQEYNDEFKAYGYMNNPNGKYDWYEVGGRWKDSLILKNGTRADSATVGQIDWVKMNQQVDPVDAGRLWELYIEKKTPKNKKEKEMLTSVWYRESYYLDKYKTKEMYMKAMPMFSTHAVVTEGEWKEAGSMGMFGSSSATPADELDWQLNFYTNWIKGLKRNTLITVVDCHV